MTNILFFPLITDWVFKDPAGDVVTEVRFDSIEALQPPEFKHDMDHMSVEPLTGSDTLEISTAAWREGVDSIQAFVERAFGLVKSRWPMLIDPDMEITFDDDQTSVKVEIGSASVDKFERTTVFFRAPVTNEPMLRLEAWDPSFPMRLQSWMAWQDSVDRLIEVNTDMGL